MLVIYGYLCTCYRDTHRITTTERDSETIIYSFRDIRRALEKIWWVVVGKIALHDTKKYVNDHL